MLLAALALGLLCVIAWGYRMWWQRRPTGSRFGRAPNRVGWRRVPVPALVVGVPLAIAVGWALPLLGITLAGFLALDAAVSAGRSSRGGRTGRRGARRTCPRPTR